MPVGLVPKELPIPKLMKGGRLPVSEIKREQENAYRAVIWRVPRAKLHSKAILASDRGSYADARAH